MLENEYFERGYKTSTYTKYQYIPLYLINFISYISSSGVNIFVINEENKITNLYASDLMLEMLFSENKSVKWLDKEDKITIFENNILRYESPLKQPKYYNPNILTLSYSNTIVFDSKLIKKSFNSKNINTKIFLKDISYSALLLFLKLIENPDSLINQIKIQDFLDIILIISLLGIEKSKKRYYFLKDLVKNVISEIYNENFSLDFEKYYNSYNYKHIRKSILMDLWIIFIDFITFNDKSAKRYIVLSGNKNLIFNKTWMFANPQTSMKKNIKDKLYIRFDDVSIRKIYKIINLKYFMNTWIFLFKISKLDLLYIISLQDEIYRKFVMLFSRVTFHADKLYIFSPKKALNLLLNKYVPVFSNKLNTLKLESSFTTVGLKELLEKCKIINNMTLRTEIFDHEKLRIMIDFASKSPNKIYKLICQKYEFSNVDLNTLEHVPSNLKLYTNGFQSNSVDIELPTRCIPFLNIYSYAYVYLGKSSLYNFILLLECFKFKSVDLNFTGNTSPYRLEDSIFGYLKYVDSIKYLFLRNISISSALLEYVYKSNTIISFELVCSACSYNLDFLSINSNTNQNLKSMSLNNLSSDIDPSFLFYLSKFKNIVNFILSNTKIVLSTSDIKNHRVFEIEEENKIHLKYLKIEKKSDTLDSTNHLHFLSKIYDFTLLLTIVYHVYNISEIEYQFFEKMKQLEIINIKICDKTASIDFKNEINYRYFNTVVMFYIDVCIIQMKDIKFLKKFKNLGYLSLYCDIFDYETIYNIKKKDFKTTRLDINRPNIAHRWKEINMYLNSEFGINFL